MPKSVRVAVYYVSEDREVEYPSYVEASKDLGIGAWLVRRYAKGEVMTPQKLTRSNILIYTVEDEPVRTHTPRKGTKRGRKGSRVYALDLYTHEIIDTYNTLKEASEDVGGHITNISKACRGELQQAYGYKWEYVD